jgi:hypothetical protein
MRSGPIAPNSPQLIETVVSGRLMELCKMPSCAHLGSKLAVSAVEGAGHAVRAVR